MRLGDSPGGLRLVGSVHAGRGSALWIPGRFTLVRLRFAGFEAKAVGGCARDKLQHEVALAQVLLVGFEAVGQFRFAGEKLRPCAVRFSAQLSERQRSYCSRGDSTQWPFNLPSRPRTTAFTLLW